MYTIAIVDDEQEEIDSLARHIKRYFAENGGEYTLSVFGDGADLLKNYSPVYNIIFLDVQMDQINGIRTVKKIRETDERTVIIFVTRMVKYAIVGYDIGVNNFIVKPATYDMFAVKMKKALALAERNKNKFIRIEQKGGFVSLPEFEIFYIETYQHYITYYTKNGEYRTFGTLKQVKDTLSPESFKECNRSCLVSLRHVTAIEKDEAVVAGKRLEISRQKKKEFMEALAAFWGSES